MTITAQEIKDKINYSPMSRLQIVVVMLCWIINAFDGFDVLAIGFTAPSISNAWGVSPEQLGIVFSSGLAGMMLGSFFLAPAADYFGRRKMIIIFLCVISLGLFLTAYTTRISELIGTRLVTGLGIGGLLASLNTMVSEYSSDKRRDFSVNIFAFGYNFGVIAGGIASVYLIANSGWQSVYSVGGCASLILAVAVFLYMPESIDFLLMRHPRNALEKLNKILVRMGHAPVKELPAKLEPANKSKVSVQVLFSAENFRATLTLWCGLFIAFMTLYFFLNWLPTILTTAGLDLSQGISANIVFSIGGIVGMLALGYFSATLGLLRLLKVYFVCCSVAIVLLVAVDANVTGILIATTILGFFVYGTIGGLYATAARLYPAEARTTGFGWAIGIGRFGSILSPAVAGYLFTAGWSSSSVYLVFAAPPIFAVLAFWRLRALTTKVHGSLAPEEGA